MSFSFDLYVQRRSWLHSADPRVKLFLVCAGTVLILLFKNIFVMLGALVLVHLLIISAGIPKERFTWVWKTMVPINILVPTLYTLFYPQGPVLIQIAFVKITLLAFIQGVTLALRLDAIAFLVFSWMFTTDQTSLVRSLVKLGLPFEWGLVLAIGLRYIPTFYGLFQVVSDAQQARGLDLTEGNFFHRVKQYLPILVAMIISALRTSDSLAKALESRALGVRGVKRTYLKDIHFQPLDYVYVGVICTVFGVFAYLRFAHGFGVHPLYVL